MRRARTMALLALAGGVGMAGCGEAAREIVLGPYDGFDLPGIDLERIQVGEEAPDFSLLSFRGDTVTLSDYRGKQDVVLVFYRGSW